jgi:hypothetical protein
MTLERAQEKVGVVRERVNGRGKRGNGQWNWRLPSAEANGDLEEDLEDA